MNIHKQYTLGLLPLQVYVCKVVHRLIELDKQAHQADPEELKNIEALREPLRLRLKSLLEP